MKKLTRAEIKALASKIVRELDKEASKGDDKLRDKTFEAALKSVQKYYELLDIKAVSGNGPIKRQVENAIIVDIRKYMSVRGYTRKTYSSPICASDFVKTVTHRVNEKIVEDELTITQITTTDPNELITKVKAMFQ